MHGRVLDAATQKPLVNASVDVWEASTNGESRFFVCHDEAPLIGDDKVCTSNRTKTKSIPTCEGNSSPIPTVNMPFMPSGRRLIQFLLMARLVNYFNYWTDIHIVQHISI